MFDIVKDSLSEALKALKKNILPAIILWCFAASIIFAYFNWQASRWVFDAVLNLKQQQTHLFVFLSTGTFGSIVPALFNYIVLQNSRVPLSQTIVLFLFWGIKGIEIEYLYLFQSWAFGDNVIYKTLFDEFIYVPIWGITSVVLFYFWMDCHYNFQTFRDTLGKQWYRNRVLAVMIPNWVVWIPAVCFIYMLPQPLQLPLQNLTLAFWVMILAYISQGQLDES